MDQAACVNSISVLDLLDGNISLSSSISEPNSPSSIPVHISEYRNEKPMLQPMRLPIRKTIRRNNIILQSMDLPVIMNINPRSIYNKTDEFSLLLDQYQADVIMMSESWERDNLPLDELLNLDNYKILSNVKQRDFKGGKPEILVNEEKYFLKSLCPEPITLPVGSGCRMCLSAINTKKCKTPN